MNLPVLPGGGTPDRCGCQGKTAMGKAVEVMAGLGMQVQEVSIN
jgi:hypothetical protein